MFFFQRRFVIKRITVFSVLLVLVLGLSLALAACDKGGTNDDDFTYYTVTFDSLGGTAVESQEVLAGNPARAPASPKKDNFKFTGWYTSADDNASLWNFATDRVNKDITLYAHWETATQLDPTPTLQYETSGNGYVVTGDKGQDTSIVIPSEYGGLPVIGIANDAFAYSRHPSDITSVYIPDSVTEIGTNAFYSRQSDLVTVEIGQNSQLQKIGANAFSGARLLEGIYIPASVTEIGNSAFNNCGSLENIDVANDNAVYKSENGHLIEKSSNTLIRGGSNPVVPDGVQIIGEAAFSYGKQTTLTIPTSVESIQSRAITDSAIESITFLGTETQWNELLSNSNRMWNMSKRNVSVTFANSETAPTALLSDRKELS